MEDTIINVMQRKTNSKLSRRDVFRAGGLAASAAAASAGPEHTAGARETASERVYTTRIGVRPFIDLAALTIDGGLLTLPQGKKAMEEAPAIR